MSTDKKQNLPILKIDNFSADDVSATFVIKYKDEKEAEISAEVKKNNKADCFLNLDSGEIDKMYVKIGSNRFEMFRIKNRVEWEYPLNGRAGDSIYIRVRIDPTIVLVITDKSDPPLEKIEFTIYGSDCGYNPETFSFDGINPIRTGWDLGCIMTCELVVNLVGEPNDRPSVQMHKTGDTWYYNPGDNINVTADETSDG